MKNRVGIAKTYVLTAVVAFVMLAGGAAHLTTPQEFFPLVPRFLPRDLVLLLTGVLQLGIGLAALWPRSRAYAGLAFATLCLCYLPLHLWDFWRPDPVFAPPVAAAARVLFQLLFIAAGWALWKKR